MLPLPRFASHGITDLEKDSDLALFLLNYITQCREAASGAWHGERETRRLQNTCHAAEALSELDLGQITTRLVEPALKWLAELPLLRTLLPQDRYAVRVYPVRFKSLAQLKHFSGARLHEDFSELHKHFDTQTGWLLDVPGEFKTALATMIWLDALVELRAHNLGEPAWQTYLPKGLDAIEAALKRWLTATEPDERGAGKPTEITNTGDAAYAFDLLCRAERIIPDSLLGKQMRDAFLRVLAKRQHDESLTKRAIYAALQLARYFNEESAVRAAIADLLHALRARYEAGALTHQPMYFHAIVLRLLVALHRTHLREAILETLWVRHQQSTTRAEDDLAQRQHDALTKLIHQHVDVKLGTVTRLSGTRTRAAVYRVHFSLESDATDKEGHAFSVLPDALRLIVKQGSIESLSRTIRRYNELPDALRPYFAKHAAQPEVSSDGQWYLTMEDLVGMSPLSEVLDALDLHTAGRAEHERTSRCAAAVGEALRALHTHRRRPPIAGNELNWLYLNPISQAIHELQEALPELRRYVENGFETNGSRRKPLPDYVAALTAHAATLTPPMVGAVHGDCHSRNLLLDPALTRAKFVDLETLTYVDDYLIDYGQLLEDVALYRYLPRGQRANALLSEEIFTDGKTIDYPSVPRQAETVLFFEEALLAQVENFARQVNDANYKPRLWLCVARNLIQLMHRQLPLAKDDPYRREEALKLILVTYAEALRLLEELTSFLEKRETLPVIPFK